MDGKAIGFAQCQLRTDYVEGTDSSPVGYLEGIFVEKEYRKCGYAKELLTECENWAKEKQCTEFASDCELVNEDSFHFHMALGFEEANRICALGIGSKYTEIRYINARNPYYYFSMKDPDDNTIEITGPYDEIGGEWE